MPNTFLWGEDVASKNKGGVFNVTKGMLAGIRQRASFNGPIAEDFILGSADGLLPRRSGAYLGMRRGSGVRRLLLAGNGIVYRAFSCLLAHSRAV